MHRIKATAFATGMLICMITFGQPSGTNAPSGFGSGSYGFRRTVPAIPDRGRDLARPATVAIDGETLRITTRDKAGNPIELTGTIRNGSVTFGVTTTEGSDIVSYHYLGRAISGNKATGTVHGFVNGQPAFEGEWALIRKQLRSRQ